MLCLLVEVKKLKTRSQHRKKVMLNNMSAELNIAIPPITQADAVTSKYWDQ